MRRFGAYWLLAYLRVVTSASFFNRLSSSGSRHCYCPPQSCFVVFICDIHGTVFGASSRQLTGLFPTRCHPVTCTMADDDAKVFVGGLAPELNDEGLRARFEMFGRVTHAKVDVPCTPRPTAVLWAGRLLLTA